MKSENCASSCFCGKSIKIIKVKVKWCICIAPFPYEDAQRRFTMINSPPADRKHIEASSKCSMYMLRWYSFYRPRKDRKLSELWRERRSPKYTTLDQAGDRTLDLRVGRQRSCHCANQPANYAPNDKNMAKFRLEQSVKAYPQFKGGRGHLPSLPDTSYCLLITALHWKNYPLIYSNFRSKI